MSQHGISLSLRLDLPDGTRFGPGKARLLEAIIESGSISAAAKSMGMSYPRALRLIEEMNAPFNTPLVETFQGGATRGGAKVTENGETILAHYRAIQEQASRISDSDLKSVATRLA